MAETLTVDPSPDTEVLTPDEQESLQIGEELQTQQDNLLAGKYKDAQELEKAYIELQGKLGEGKEEETTDTEASTEEESETDESAPSDILERLWDQAKSENFQEDTIKELAEMDPGKLAQMHLEYRANNMTQTISEEQVGQLKDIAGGEKEYQSMMGWAQNTLNENEINMYDAVMDKGDPLACFFAVQAMKYRYDDASGTEGRMLTGKAPNNSGNQFKSQAQVIEAMNDPKYENDPAYRREIMEKLSRSDIEF